MQRIKILIFKTCPKSGRIVGFNKKGIFYKLFFPLVGLMSLIWFLVRVIPKPDRISYPCQQVAAPFAISFLASIAGYVTLIFTFRNFTKFLRQHRYSLAIFMGVVSAAAGMVVWYYAAIPALAARQYGMATGIFTPSDKPNTPVGTAKGIFPGRVVWAHDPLAAQWDGTGLFFEPRFNSQDRINHMLESTLCSLTGMEVPGKAWQRLFEYHNENQGKGKTGYREGEKIAVKVNLNCNGGWNKIDVLPQKVHSLLKQLVEEAGVRQEDILLYDAMRRGISAVFNYNAPHYPDVKYNEWGHFVAGSIHYSAEINDSLASSLPSGLLEAEYLINLAALKRHCQPTDNYRESSGQTGITCCAKNHFGSIANPSALHLAIRDWARGMGTYNPLVDMMSNEHLGGKTLLYLIDGTYGGDQHGAIPKKFKSQPFNDAWPSSIFASLDICAIESVALDFLNAEMDLVANADNFLHEAALIGNPPSGIEYLGKGKVSLGVHEHWNNPEDKQYSRNLGRPEGIELFRAPIPEDRPVIDYFFSEGGIVSPGDSLRLHWKTANAGKVFLNGQVVPPAGVRTVHMQDSEEFLLTAIMGDRKTEFRLPVRVYANQILVQAEDCRLSATAVKGRDGEGWTGNGWISLTGERNNPGQAEFEVVAPHSGMFDFIVTYNGSFPNPATLTVNGEVVSQSIGFEITEGWNWKRFIYPVSLNQGANTIIFSQVTRQERAIHFDKFAIAY